jgi:hypothetical protein
MIHGLRLTTFVTYDLHDLRFTTYEYSNALRFALVLLSPTRLAAYSHNDRFSPSPQTLRPLCDTSPFSCGVLFAENLSVRSYNTCGNFPDPEHSHVL